MLENIGGFESTDTGIGVKNRGNYNILVLSPGQNEVMYGGKLSQCLSVVSTQ